jgi:hypothetical protein
MLINLTLLPSYSAFPCIPLVISNCCIERRSRPVIDYYQAISGERIYLQIRKNILQEFSKLLQEEMKKKTYCLPDFSQLTLNDFSMLQNYKIRGLLQVGSRQEQKSQDYVSLLNKVHLPQDQEIMSEFSISFANLKFSILTDFSVKSFSIISSYRKIRP